VKALADRAVGVGERELECLRNIVSVHVVHRLHPEVGEDDFFAIRQTREHRRVEVSRWIHGRPSRPDDMARVHDRRANLFTARCVEQPSLDRRFFDSVIAEGRARQSLRGRNDRAMSVDPHRSAVEKQRVAFCKRAGQVLGAFQREADQVDDDVGPHRRDALAESASGFFRDAIDRHALDVGPGAVRLIGFARPATGGNDLVPGRDESGNEEGADVACRADDDDSDGRLG